MTATQPGRSATDETVAGRIAWRESFSPALSAADTGVRPAGQPVWEAQEALRHVDMVWDAVLVRNTQGHDFEVDRAVYEAGHGRHGGWLITPDREVACGGGAHHPPRVLFPIGDVLLPSQQDELIRGIAQALASQTRPRGAAA